MFKFLEEFADHPFGRWTVNGLSVMAFFIVAHLLAARLRDSGVLGAFKALIMSA